MEKACLLLKWSGKQVPLPMTQWEADVFQLSPDIFISFIDTSLWYITPCTDHSGSICRRTAQTSKTTEAKTFVNISAPWSWLPVPRIHPCQLPTPSTWNASHRGRCLEQRTTKAKLVKITDSKSSFSFPSGPKVGRSAREAVLFCLKFPFQQLWINTQTIFFSLRPLSADAFEAGRRQEETATKLGERYFIVGEDDRHFELSFQLFYWTNIPLSYNIKKLTRLWAYLQNCKKKAFFRR